MSDIWIKKSNTNPKWAKAIAIHIKRYSGATTKWFAAKVIWIKNTSQGWLRVWPTSGVFAITDPYITTTASGSTPLYGNQTVGTNDVIRIGTTYYGRNGTWDPNGFSISSYSYSWPYYSSSDPTINYDELGSLASGVYASPSQSLNISSVTNATAADGNYISFRITANASNSLYSNTADSKDSYGKIKVIRRTPQNISYSLDGEPAIGQTLSFSSSWNITEAYKPNASRSTIKWYKVDDLTNIYSGGSRVEITRASNSYSITLQSSDDVSGKYIIAEETVFNTGSDYDIGENQFINGQNQVTAVTASAVGVALSFSNVVVKDNKGNSGLDNRGRWPTGTLNQYTGQLNGYDSNTNIRIRYRIYNFDTGRYYKPSTGQIQADSAAGASAAWDSWNSNGSGNGYISNVSVSGGVATFYDYFDLETFASTFNGGGSGPTWWLEVELSAIKTGGTRVYYINPYETFYISKRIDSSVSATPSTVALNTNVTVSGGFVGYPATPSTNAYPKQYKVDYGDNTDSGWLPVGEYAFGTLNPTYSLTKQYTTAGSYIIRTTTIPYGTDATTTITASSGPTAPTSLTATNNSGAIRLTFSGGSGDQYDIYYSNSSTRPTDGQAFADYPNVTSPYDPPLTSRNIERWFWVRKSSGSLRSNWYPSDSSVSIRLPLLSPPDFTITNSAQTSTSLSWHWTQPTPSSSQDEPTSWDWAITQSTSTPSIWPNNVTTRPTSSSPLVTSGLTENTTYYLHVRAKNQDASTTTYQSGTTSAATTLYTVTFNTNGASGSPSVSSVTQSTQGGSVTLATKGTMSSTGNIFGGWRTGTSSGTQYAFGASFTPTSNITLYAYYGATPTCSAPSANFSRWPTNTSSNWEYYSDYPTPSGAYSSISSMEYEIYTTQTGSTLIAGGSGTLAYPTGGDLYPYRSERNGTYWSFRVASGSGGRVATTSARWGRFRVKMIGIDGSTYNGTWTARF